MSVEICSICIPFGSYNDHTSITITMESPELDSVIKQKFILSLGNTSVVYAKFRRDLTLQEFLGHAGCKL